jgi:CPA1 family monovalent cation:H+ antiporter
VHDAELMVFLLLAVAVLAGLGLRLRVPYPVVLVLGGLVIGLVPGLPSPRLDADVVFFAFLPPLVYSAAVSASAYELRANARPIAWLATGLVLVTIAAVAAVAHAVLGVSWKAAFVLGAVLGPTDPVTASAVLNRLGLSGRMPTILEGESLINDGTALTAYKIAIGTAAATAPHIAWEFVAEAAGGIAIGLAAGWVFTRLRAYVTDPSLDVTLSVITPFVSYVPAERIGASGVLAVVAAGLLTGLSSLDAIEAGTRLRTLAFWQSTTFLLDGLLFLLVGLQVPAILDGIEGARPLTLARDVLLITAVVLVVRFAWMAVARSLQDRAERIALGWSGMRGGISLAAALAIPATVPDRDLVIFVAYGAIVITLVLPGLTLAPLLVRLGVCDDADKRRADAEARLRITHAALERLEEAAETDGLPEQVIDRLRDRYEARLERLEARLEDEEHTGRGSDVRDTAQLIVAMIEAEREALRAMRRERAYPADTLREIERELDLDESRVRARIRL